MREPTGSCGCCCFENFGLTKVGAVSDEQKSFSELGHRPHRWSILRRNASGGLGMGGKAPHSALLALQAMQPPVKPGQKGDMLVG